MSTLTAAGFVPPIPTTVRGSPSLIGCDASGKLLAYASGSNVVIRSVLNFDDTVAFFTEHATAVTSVRLSPNGSQCASGDQGGNLIIWNVNSKGQFNSQKYQPLSGAVKDIAWSHDSERLAVVGEGKDTCGVVLNAAMGTTMGKLTGHTKSISTVDFRKDRPFRVASGSLDSNVNFYEGPPFVFKSSTSGHQGTVTCIRFSPGHDLIASVSGSDSILIQDAKTGEKIRTVPTGHTGTIYALAWINNDSVATASADKSVRTTNIRDSTQQLHVKLGDDLGSMQLGVASSAVGLISLGLNGRLTLIDESGSVSRVIDGQNQTIKGLGFFGSTGVAVSSEGRVLVFDPSAISSASTIDQKDCDFVKTVVQVADSVVLAGSESLFTVGISTKSLNGGVPAKGAVGVAATQGVIIAVTSASALVYRDDKQVATVALATDLKPVAAAAGGSTVAIAGASSVQLFKLVGDGLEPSVALKGKHQSDVTAVAVSADGTHVATGDSTKVIFVWNAQTGEVVYENLVFHSSRINCLAFAPSSNTILASGSLDRSVIVWDLPNQKRSSVPNAHFNGTTAVVWSSANQLVTAGADYCVRFWSL